MMSPNHSRPSSHATKIRHTPLQIIHVIGNLLRIWSVYSMYRYLSQTGASVVLFIFSCLVPSMIVFLILQKPWKGRPHTNTQVVPSLINGGITALYYILWGIGLYWRRIQVLFLGCFLQFCMGGEGIYGKRLVGLLQCWHHSTSCLKDGPWPLAELIWGRS